MEKTRYPFLQLAESGIKYRDELKRAVAEVIDSGRYLHGPQTEAFECELAQYCGCNDIPALGVSNGLDALRLIFRSYIELGVLVPGDEVLVPANTYIASILPLLEFGLVPVLIEPDAADYCIDFEKADAAITAATRAVLLVHLYGNPCWDEAMIARWRERNLLIIEDNAQAIGADIAGCGLHGSRRTGYLADAAAFSFYPTKNLGAMGDAGAILTRDRALREVAKALANYGSDRRYHNVFRGYNCRMDEMQAALLRVKLRHLDEETEQRRTVAEVYSQTIDHPLVTAPRIYTDRRQVWHQYPIHTSARDKLRKYLLDHGIATDIHYATPPHKQPCMRDVQRGSLPITERLADTEISLPIANISASDAQHISHIINEFHCD